MFDLKIVPTHITYRTLHGFYGNCFYNKAMHFTEKFKWICQSIDEMNIDRKVTRSEPFNRKKGAESN